MLQEANRGKDKLLHKSINKGMIGQSKHQFLGNRVKYKVRARYLGMLMSSSVGLCLVRSQ